MMLPDVAPVSSRSGAVVVASLAGPAVSVVAPVPLVVVEQAAMTMTSREQPDVATVVSEGVAQSAQSAVQAVAPEAG